jgi:AcrR family transcriptional regulator
VGDSTTRRDGAQTREQAQRIALELFTAQGYEATSLRQIAERLGINKASLYYHFPNKQAILRSLVEERGSEAEQLLAWVESQPASPELLEEAVRRWVESYSADKLEGIRFLRANPLVARSLAAGDGDRIGDPLTQIAELLTAAVPGATPRDAVLVRMALLSINAAVSSVRRSGRSGRNRDPGCDRRSAGRRASAHPSNGSSRRLEGECVRQLTSS